MRISDNIMSRELEDETIILDLKAGQYFSLDPVGSHFWRLLDAGKTVSESISALLLEYDVDETTLRNDIGALVDQLCARNILTE